MSTTKRQGQSVADAIDMDDEEEKLVESYSATEDEVDYSDMPKLIPVQRKSAAIPKMDPPALDTTALYLPMPLLPPTYELVQETSEEHASAIPTAPAKRLRFAHLSAEEREIRIARYRAQDKARYIAKRDALNREKESRGEPLIRSRPRKEKTPKMSDILQAP